MGGLVSLSHGQDHLLVVSLIAVMIAILKYCSALGVSALIEVIVNDAAID